MMRSTAYGVLPAVVMTVFLSCIVQSCSTTRVLAEGECRVCKNKVVVLNDKKFNSSRLNPYMKQNGVNWSPSLCIYNWQDGKGKGWDRFVTKLGKAPVVFDSTLIDPSITNMCNHLQNLGYYNSNGSASIKRKGERKVSVIYSITLGKRFPVRSISYTLPSDSSFVEDFCRDTVNCMIREGDFLSEALLEKESVRASTAMRNVGYYAFNKNHFFFEADTISHPDAADLKIIVRNHTRNETAENDRPFNKCSIGRITVTVPEKLKIREKVLRDLNNIKSGDLYSEEKINILYSRFTSIQLFSSVNVSTDLKEKDVVDCDIKLQKAKINGFKLGLEASFNSSGLIGFSPSISYYNKNIFHGGEILNVSVSTNHQFKVKGESASLNEVSVNASLVFPRLLPFPTRWFKGRNIPRTELNGSYNFQSRPEYRRNTYSLNFGYLGNVRKKNFLYYTANPISLSIIDLPYIDPEFAKTLEDNPYLKNAYQAHFDLGINGSLYYSNVSSLNTTRNFWYINAKGDLAGNLVSAFNSLMQVNEEGQRLVLRSPYSQYVRGEFTFGSTLFWGREKHIRSFACRLLLGAGLGYGNSTALPFEKRFFVGGSNSMRGWVAKTLGPGSSPKADWKIPNQTGDMKFEINAEYRIRMFWKVEGALFVDAGNIWNLGPDSDEDSKFRFDRFFQTVALDWGAGIRFNLNFIILRLDLGMRLYDPCVQDGDKWINPEIWFPNNYAIHFGVGYPF